MSDHVPATNGPRFRWRVAIEIRAANGLFEITRTIDLPFVPQSGMEVAGLFGDNDVGVTIGPFCYDLDDGQFWVYPEESDDRDLDRDFTAGDAREYLECGCLVDGCDDLGRWPERRAYLISMGRYGQYMMDNPGCGMTYQAFLAASPASSPGPG